MCDGCWMSCECECEPHRVKTKQGTQSKFRVFRSYLNKRQKLSKTYWTHNCRRYMREKSRVILIEQSQQYNWQNFNRFQLDCLFVCMVESEEIFFVTVPNIFQCIKFWIVLCIRKNLNCGHGIHWFKLSRSYTGSNKCTNL